MVSLRSAEAKPPRSVHRLDEPAGLSLSMVASPQCRLWVARQNHSSAAATSAANFRVACHLGAIRKEHMYRVSLWGLACAGRAAQLIHQPVEIREAPLFRYLAVCQAKYSDFLNAHPFSRRRNPAELASLGAG